MTTTYPKNKSLLMKIINVLLIIITFGKQNRFMTHYVTTIGDKIYVPDTWNKTDLRVKDMVIVHEEVHIKQYKKEKFLFYFKYLFWPLPLFHAHARLEYEIEAYATEIVYGYKRYGTPIFNGRVYNNVISQLSGPMYFWTCVNKAYIGKRLTLKIFELLKVN